METKIVPLVLEITSDPMIMQRKLHDEIGRADKEMKGWRHKEATMCATGVNLNRLIVTIIYERPQIVAA